MVDALRFAWVEIGRRPRILHDRDDGAYRPKFYVHCKVRRVLSEKEPVADGGQRRRLLKTHVHGIRRQVPVRASQVAVTFKMRRARF